jgi:hypothetical protein
MKFDHCRGSIVGVVAETGTQVVSTPANDAPHFDKARAVTPFGRLDGWQSRLRVRNKNQHWADDIGPIFVTSRHTHILCGVLLTCAIYILNCGVAA